MEHIHTEEASNGDRTIISELLNSSSDYTNQLCRKNNLLSVQNNSNQNLITYNTCSKNTTSVSDNDNHNENSQFEDIGDISKMHMPPVHIPYILNGELYQIQTQDGENVTVKCCHCPPDRVYRGSVRSTGNFHMHIKRRHPDLLEKLHDMKVNALLERRDRLMRNRKITHRTNHSRHSAIVNAKARFECLLKSEDKSGERVEESINSHIPLDSSSEMSMMHKHKLKIKAVFLRHQMQQKEAEMRNFCNSSDYIVMPVDKLTSEGTDEPINYSFKSQEDKEIITHIPSSPLTQQRKTYQELQNGQRKEQNRHYLFVANCCYRSCRRSKSARFTMEFAAKTVAFDLQIVQTSCNDFENVTIQAANLTDCCESTARAKNLSISASSISTSCPSVMSNFSSNQQYDMETFQHYNVKHRHWFIVKPEHLLGTDNEAIDLSMHTDSGIFSNSDDDDVVEQNKNTYSIGNNNVINRSGAQKSNGPQTTTNNCRHNVDNNKNNYNNILNSRELLARVETTLRDIQQEINIRNQIESSRIFLDIAKFKFLHPGFQFDW